MNVVYQVWSSTFNPETKETKEQHDLTRTDRHTAEYDARLLHSITGRRAWVKEVQAGEA